MAGFVISRFCTRNATLEAPAAAWSRTWSVTSKTTVARDRAVTAECVLLKLLYHVGRHHDVVLAGNARREVPCGLRMQQVDLHGLEFSLRGLSPSVSTRDSAGSTRPRVESSFNETREKSRVEGFTIVYFREKLSVARCLSCVRGNSHPMDLPNFSLRRRTKEAAEAIGRGIDVLETGVSLDLGVSKEDVIKRRG